MAAILQWDPNQDVAIRQFVEPEIDLPCLIPWRFIFIQEHTKKTFACPYHAIPSGDLAKNSLDEIWNSEVAQEMRRSLLQKEIPLFCLNHSASCPVIMKARASGHTVPAQSKIEIGKNDFWMLDKGWYRLEYIPEPIRWTSERAAFRICAAGQRALRLEVLTLRPGLAAEPLKGRITLDGYEAGSFAIERPEWESLTLDIPMSCRKPELLGELVIDNPWVPKEAIPDNEDTRTLGVAVRRIWTF
jgi:hypothetical protein